MTESMATTGSPRTGFSKKIRTLAIGALATAALSVPAVTTASIAGHDAWKAPIIKPASHRLALSFTPLSLRLT